MTTESPAAEKAPRTPLRAAAPLSCILAMLLTFALLSACMLGVLRTALSHENIARTISSIDIGAIMKTISPDDAPDNYEASGSVPAHMFALTPPAEDTADSVEQEQSFELGDLLSRGDEAIADYIFDACGEEMLGEYSIDRESLGEIIERTNVEEFIANKAADAAENVFTNGNLNVLGPEAFVELLRDNSDVIYDVTGYQITDEDFEMIGGKLSAVSVGIEYSEEEIRSALGFDPTLISKVTSVIPYIAAISAAVICVILILVLNSFLCGRSFRYISIPGLIAGILMFCAAAAIGAVSGALLDGLFAPLFTGVSTAFTVRAAVCLAVGVVLLTVSFPLKKRNI